MHKGWLDPKYDKVVDQYRSGMMVKDIAALYGIQPNCIGRQLQKRMPGYNARMDGRRRDPRYKDIVSLFDSGKTAKELAELYGVGICTIEDVLKTRGIERGDKRGYKHMLGNPGGRNREAKEFRSIVAKAKREGVLVAPELCSECHEKKKLSGHHDDYSKPLEVRWLCTRCHNKFHQAEKTAKRHPTTDPSPSAPSWPGPSARRNRMQA